MPDLAAMRVVWVDDRSENNTARALKLTQAGAEIHSARSNDELAKSVDAYNFDAIISDVSRDTGPDAGVPDAGFVGIAGLREKGIDTPVFFFPLRVDPERTERAKALNASLTNSARPLITELAAAKPGSVSLRKGDAARDDPDPVASVEG